MDMEKVTWGLTYFDQFIGAILNSSDISVKMI